MVGILSNVDLSSCSRCAFFYCLVRGAEDFLPSEVSWSSPSFDGETCLPCREIKG